MEETKKSKALDDSQMEEVSGGMSQQEFLNGIIEPIGEQNPEWDGGMFRVTCRVCGHVMEMAYNPMVRCEKCHYSMLGDLGMTYHELVKERRKHGLS